MKIVIDIPQKTYNEIKERTIVTCGEMFAKKLVGYIRNGTPLKEYKRVANKIDTSDVDYYNWENECLNG